MIFKRFINNFELGTFLPKFSLNIAGAKNIFEINPIFLNNQPIIDNKSGPINNFLQLLSLIPLSFQIAITKYGGEIGQQLIQLPIQLINLIHNIRIFIFGIFRLVLFYREL
jgi:hypothetical protein